MGKLVMRMSEKQPTIAKYNMDLWGKDHWSVFAYIHDLCVNSLDNIGTPDLRRIQCNLGRHPGLVSMNPMTGKPRDGSAYGIRLFDRELPGADYDERDCIDDIEAEKLIELKGTGINPCFTMTDKGHEMITKLLKHKSTGGNFSDFKR